MRSQSGQGLIEIIIVVLIIGGSILALLRFQNALAYADTLSQQQNEASILAESNIEKLRTFQVYNVQSPYAAYASIASGSTVVAGSTTSFTVTWTITANANPTYKAVHVVVTWNDIRNVARSITVDSYIAGIEPGYSASVMY